MKFSRDWIKTLVNQLELDAGREGVASLVNHPSVMLIDEMEYIPCDQQSVSDSVEVLSGKCKC